MSSGVMITGAGAVSPAGWTSEALYHAVREAPELPTETLQRAKGAPTVRTRPVPETEHKVRHPRLRRVSPVTRYAVSAALEALGEGRLNQTRASELRLGVIVNVTNGCVAHTRRFYEEALEDPATASPILFPETVFNSPASHIAAVIGTTAANYTLLGDPTQFFSGIDLAAFWLESELVDGCLVVTTEELDWLSSEAIQLFEPEGIIAGGAGALFLERRTSGPGVELAQVTKAFSYTPACPPEVARELMWKELPRDPADTLFVTANGDANLEPARQQLILQPTLGFSLVTPAWQAVTAYEALRRDACAQAVVPGIGTNQQAIGLCLRRSTS